MCAMAIGAVAMAGWVNLTAVDGARPDVPTGYSAFHRTYEQPWVGDMTMGVTQTWQMPGAQAPTPKAWVSIHAHP
jgi:hypothetical protein